MRPTPKNWKRLLRRTACALVLGYAALLALLVAFEPSLVYRPMTGPSEPSQAGLQTYSRHTLASTTTPPIIYWENTAPAHAPTVFYFHGNGGGLFMHAPNLRKLDGLGLHIIAMEYPSYPSTEGRPSEAMILAQANALWDAKHTPKAVIWGYSLGSGIATQLAAQHHPSALVLEAPFTAVVDRAAELFPLFPVRLLMKNTYRSRDFITRINAPLFIMHGTDDLIIPLHHGRDLFALALEPKTLKIYEGAGHLNLDTTSAYDDAASFIRRYTGPTAH